MATKTRKASGKAKGGADVIYNMVTERIVKALEEGTVPWKKSWVTQGGVHINMVTKIPYRGINPFLLELTSLSRGFTSPHWLSLNQINKLKGEVLESELKEYTVVIYWKLLTKETDEIDPKTGKWKIKKSPFLRYYRVYNIEQTVGIDPKKIPAVPTLNEEFTPIKRAELALDYEGRPQVKHSQGFNPSYQPLTDTVRMPTRKQFVSTEDYYTTRFHEEIHGTGHETRLNRPGVAKMDYKGSDRYAEEELVAEMGAAFLAAQFGIEGEDQHEQEAAYIKSWIKRFNEDKKLLVNSAAKAQKACEFILDGGKVKTYND